MGINGLSRLRWLGVMAPEARNPAEAGPPFLTILLASCGTAAPVAPGARRPERSHWRCGAPKGHGEASPPSDHCRLGPVRRTSRAFVVGAAVRNAGREARRCHGGGPTRGDAVTDLPLIKAAKLWAKVSARTGATYLTGRWGGCGVLVSETLERAGEAEPSHFLFLGEAGEWPVSDQAI